MQSIILAAGMGKRLKELTKNNTKCMVKINGETLIERMLKQLDRHNLSRIIIVVGYKSEILKNHIKSINIHTPIIFVENDKYSTTNNIYSLSLTKEYFNKEDTILFESDIIVDDALIDEIIDEKEENLAIVSKYESWIDGIRVILNTENKIERFIPENEFELSDFKRYYKAISLYKFSKSFINKHYIPSMEAYINSNSANETYDQVLSVINAKHNVTIPIKKIDNGKWYEINDIQDVELANIYFNDDEDDKLNRLQSSFGGYWRFGEMLDYNFLVNPYFPPKKLLKEIKANFDNIITQYPSGLKVNSMLAAKCFGISSDNIIVGNGTSEYIKIYMEYITGRVGFISPTFDEYPNRYDSKKSIVFVPDNDEYIYNQDDIINFFKDKQINTVVLVNPDNPSGNYIDSNGLNKLIKWTKESNINLVIDESFVDFSEEEYTLIQQDLLNDNPHLIVLKSISKSYGVPGLRLGVLASGDKELIAKMKKMASIWNINSLAEFYMQIEGKYHQDYLLSLKQIKKERSRFISELKKLPHIKVINSQANYVMIKLLGEISSRQLTKNLLLKHNILIKDLYKKVGGKNYIRIAVRNTRDNNKLLKALNKELC